jgi:hypothetical protein
MLLQREMTLRLTDLPEEASLYLPLGIVYDPTAPRVLVMVDDRHQKARPELSEFPENLDGDPVVAVKRVELHTAPGAQARWKVFELSVSRRP